MRCKSCLFDRVHALLQGLLTPQPGLGQALKKPGIDWSCLVIFHIFYDPYLVLYIYIYIVLKCFE